MDFLRAFLALTDKLDSSPASDNTRNKRLLATLYVIVGYIKGQVKSNRAVASKARSQCMLELLSAPTSGNCGRVTPSFGRPHAHSSHISRHCVLTPQDGQGPHTSLPPCAIGSFENMGTNLATMGPPPTTPSPFIATPNGNTITVLAHPRLQSLSTRPAPTRFNFRERHGP